MPKRRPIGRPGNDLGNPDAGCCLFSLTRHRILFESLHSAADREALRFTDGVDVLVGPGGWPEHERPRPEGARVIQAPEGHYDLYVGWTPAFVLNVPGECPFVANCHDPVPGPVRKEIDERACLITFFSKEQAEIHCMGSDPRTRIVGHGIDGAVFSGWRDDDGGVLSCGNFLPKRADKRPAALFDVDAKIPVTLVGAGNDGYPHWKGQAASMEALAEEYRSHRAYYNPSPDAPLTMREAMATGMPVVTAPVWNFLDFIRPGVNCLLAGDAAQAVELLQDLLGSASIRQRIGAQARTDTLMRFDPEAHRRRWRDVFREALATRPSYR
jgi:hypothetical protein